eukprot:UN06709
MKDRIYPIRELDEKSSSLLTDYINTYLQKGLDYGLIGKIVHDLHSVKKSVNITGLTVGSLLTPHPEVIPRVKLEHSATKVQYDSMEHGVWNQLLKDKPENLNLDRFVVLTGEKVSKEFKSHIEKLFIEIRKRRSYIPKPELVHINYSHLRSSKNHSKLLNGGVWSKIKKAQAILIILPQHVN